MSDCQEYYVEEDPNYTNLCRCPICKGWLPRFFPTDRVFTCKKCGVELMTFPNDPKDEEAGGRICPISKPTRFRIDKEAKSD